MLLDGFLLTLGLTLLVLGGRGLVAGASQLATAFGVSEVVIGLTVVAFGTSAPELAVNGLAAVRGNAAIAFGNVIGSNIANLALVVGSAAALRPLLIESIIVSREIPMMLLATAAAVILGLDRIRGVAESYDRSDGLMFLLLFSVFLYYSAAEIVAKRRADPIVRAAEHVHRRMIWDIGRPGLLTAGGFAVLLVGAQLTVSSAVALAEAFQVPRPVIGLTLVAFGTSLPELATSLIATWRGQTSLAIGNVVGSNIFNLLFILGITACIRNVEVPFPRGGADLLSLAGFSLVFLPLSWTSGGRIQRWQGASLVFAYLAYITWRLTP